VSSGEDEPDLDHIGVRAFARLAGLDGRRFTWTSRIPRARGLGSSAAVIALGLVAAALLERGRADPAELFAKGSSSRATATISGCAPRRRLPDLGTQLVRIADRPPAVPIAVIPETTVSTSASRAALPATVTHADAAFTAGRATSSVRHWPAARRSSSRRRSPTACTSPTGRERALLGAVRQPSSWSPGARSPAPGRL